MVFESILVWLMFCPLSRDFEVPVFYFSTTWVLVDVMTESSYCFWNGMANCHYSLWWLIVCQWHSQGYACTHFCRVCFGWAWNWHCYLPSMLLEFSLQISWIYSVAFLVCLILRCYLFLQVFCPFNKHLNLYISLLYNCLIVCLVQYIFLVWTVVRRFPPGTL
jgi:hypothetical protein